MRSSARAWCWANPDFPMCSREFDKSLPVTGLAMRGEEPQPFLFDFPGLLRNVPVLEQAAAGRGLFTIKTERDGIVRRVPMIMLAQGATMPSLTFEMLRVATGSGTILIKADQAGIQSVGVRGFEIPTDRNGQLWVHFARRDPSIYVSAVDVLEGRVAAGKIAQQAGADRHLGGRAARHQDHAGRSRHARRRNSRPGARKRADPNRAVAAELRHRRRILRRARPRASGDRVCADVRTGHPRCGRRPVCDGADRNLLVFLHPAPPADRFHLSADVDHVDLSDPDLLQLRPGADAAAADPLGVRPVSVAGADRAARAVAGKARARRRGARDDDHVHRRPRLHHHLGSPTSTIRRA